MIEKFVIQTNDTIWDFLSEIGHSKEVFSYYSFREIDGYTLFFYATSKEIVLICLDIVDDGTAEYAEEGVAWTVPYLRCFTKVLPNGEMSKDYHDKRLSPAMELYTHARDMQRFFATSVKFSLVPAIHLMLLTNSRIVNYPQIVKTWQQKHFGGVGLSMTVAVKVIRLFLSMKILILQGRSIGQNGINMKIGKVSLIVLMINTIQ